VKSHQYDSLVLVEVDPDPGKPPGHPAQHNEIDSHHGHEKRVEPCQGHHQYQDAHWQGGYHQRYQALLPRQSKDHRLPLGFHWLRRFAS